MKIIEKISANKIREIYDCVIGWGAGRMEFEKRYHPFLWPMDYMIDEKDGQQGKLICGMEICNKAVLKNLTDRRLCVIIFPNVEDDVIQELEKAGIKDYDTVVARLVESSEEILPRTYSQEGEDIIFSEIMERFHITKPYYVDIGVCHPVIRNNTYVFYERGARNGLLIEPNPEMCKLIREYRPENQLIEAGVCGNGENKSLRYYVNYNKSIRGQNTFSYESAVKLGISEHYKEIPVYGVNEILKKNVMAEIDILDIDTEGMDYEILSGLDTDSYHAKLICVEENVCGNMREMMWKKGYIHYISTETNGIYLAKELIK